MNAISPVPCNGLRKTNKESKKNPTAHFTSSGLVHQEMRFPFSDALVAMEKAMKRDKIDVNDRQLACAHIKSQEGQDYLKGMASAANYAWVNRSSMTFLCRQVITDCFS